MFVFTTIDTVFRLKQNVHIVNDMDKFVGEMFVVASL